MASQHGPKECSRVVSGISTTLLPEPDDLLDTVGLYCPVPIIRTAARIRGMERGQVLEVLSDDRVILIDMPAWCHSASHEYLGQFEEQGELHLFVRKGGRSASHDRRGG